jgi:ABC-type sugar transport system ATPase subunit
MRRLAKDGCALLVISSELPEVLALCDRIGIMRGGRLVNTFDDCSELNEDLLAERSLLYDNRTSLSLCRSR